MEDVISIQGGSKSIFAERLQRYKNAMGYSQKEFAQLLGIPQPSVSAYLNGHSFPTVEALIGIASKCNLSLDWLCGNSSNVFQDDSVNHKLTRLRVTMDYTQEQFAELLELPVSMVAAIEQNQGYVDLDLLTIVAKKCNVSLEWLFGNQWDYKTQFTIPAKLRSIRNANSWTQKNLAEMIDVPLNTVAALEAGDINANLDTLVAISDNCQVSLDWLCDVSSANEHTDLLVFSLSVLRNRHKQTKEQLAKSIGVKPSAITALEERNGDLTIAILKRIAEVYEVSLDWLCSFEKSMMSITNMGMLADFLYSLKDFFEVDIEIEFDKDSSRVIFKQDKTIPYNDDVKYILKCVKEDNEALQSDTISQEMFYMNKDRIVHNLSHRPLTSRKKPAIEDAPQIMGLII